MAERCELLIGVFTRYGWGTPCGEPAEYDLTMGDGPKRGICAKHARMAEGFIQAGTVERSDGGHFERGEVIIRVRPAPETEAR